MCRHIRAFFRFVWKKANDKLYVDTVCVTNECYKIEPKGVLENRMFDHPMEFNRVLLNIANSFCMSKSQYHRTRGKKVRHYWFKLEYSMSSVMHLLVFWDSLKFKRDVSGTLLASRSQYRRRLANHFLHLWACSW